MNLGMLGILTTTILMIGLYLWAHRSIVFVIESLLQTIEVGVLIPHRRDLRSILLMMTRSLDDCISSRICNTILSLLLRALAQSRPRGEVLNLYHLLLLILLCVVLVILRHRLVGAQILRILMQRACRRCCSLVCRDVLTRVS